MAIDQEILEVSNMFRLLIKKASQDWNRGACKMNLTFPQFQILYSLNHRGSLKVSELADTLNLTSAAITGLTDKLCSQNYVERERATDDRRVVYVTITKEGVYAIDAVKETYREMNERLFDQLSKEDIQHLRRIFAQMLVNIDN